MGYYKRHTMKKLLIFLITTLTTTAFGQVELKQNPSDYLPKGYVIFEKIIGDLNKDGIEDCVLIIKGTDTSKIITDEYRGKLDRNRRGIIVLFNKKDHYELAVKTTIASLLKTKTEEFILLQNYPLKLKKEICMFIMDTADMDIGNIRSDFKIQTLS